MTGTITKSVLVLITIIVNGLFSANLSAQWEPCNGGVLHTAHIVCFARNGDKMFAAGTGDLIDLVMYRSSDYGSSWSRADSGLFTPDPDIVLSLVASGGVLLSSCSRGIFRSENDGTYWTQSLAQQFRLAQHPGSVTPVAIYGFYGTKVMRSTNLGLTWDSSLSVPLPVAAHPYPRSALIHDSTLLVAFQSPDSGYLLWSPDLGVSWQRIDNGLPSGHFDIQSFAATDSFLFAGGRYASETMMFRSADGGKSWSAVAGGLPIDNAVNSVYAFGNVLFAGVGSWTRCCGVFRSTNNGASWENVSEGLPSNNPILSFIANGAYLFAGTSYGGVSRRLLSQLTSVDEQKALQGSWSLVQNFPNPFNPVTRIRYGLAEPSFVSLRVFDVVGIEVTSLVNEKQGAGTHEVLFNASHLASGVYLYRITAGKFVSSGRGVLIK
ncbi:MAG: T9SS type A sorting domain-containing protein [Ignavibacteriae bacterium]|nr:T9SS type A sorting domain-containing protein [Ignavibacteriota bacterium]